MNETAAPPTRALLRAGEAPRIPGNDVRLLCDGPEVFAAWLADIATAKEYILFENYIFNSDQIGRRIADALAARARAGVAVYVLFDWFGCLGTSRRLWLGLKRAGAEVRAFNAPHLTRPIMALRRDHRKGVCIDGRVAFIGGLCVGDAWAGGPGVAPWRDTAVRIAGPAALAVRDAFNETWSLAGPPLPRALTPPLPPLAGAGPGAPVQVISGLPGRSRVYRLAQVLISTATSRIWISDAYFLTPPTLYEALLAAARDGVDVRILVPGRSDLPWVNWVGRAGYTGLLQAGVRIFEWAGPMLHAKTSVIDSRFCRVGSSNLNLASLMTNWELDASIDDPAFGAVMEDVFLRDLGRSSELCLQQRRYRLQGRIARTAVPVPADGAAEDRATMQADRQKRRERRLRPTGERARAVVARAGAAVLGVALRRQFERSAWSVSAVSAVLLLGVGGLGLWRPEIFGLVMGGLLCWLGVASLSNAVSQWWETGRPAKRRSYLQHAKAKDLSQVSPPPNHTEP